MFQVTWLFLINWSALIQTNDVPSYFAPTLIYDIDSDVVVVDIVNHYLPYIWLLLHAFE